MTRMVALAWNGFAFLLLSLTTGCNPVTLPVRAGDLAPIKINLSGTMEGRLDPCGCAADQKGGLAVRKTSLWYSRHLETINLEGCRFLPERKWGKPFGRFIGKTLLRCLGREKGCLDYAAIGLCAHDCHLGFATLNEICRAAKAPPLVSCDILCSGDLIKPFLIKECAGARVFITALSAGVLPPGATGFNKLPWAKALAGVLKQAPADTYRVLMLDGGKKFAKRIAAAFPGSIDILLIAPPGGYNPTPTADIKRDSPPHIIDPGTGGRHILQVALERKSGNTRMAEYLILPLIPKDPKAAPGKEKPGAIPINAEMASLIEEERTFALEDGKVLAGAVTNPIPVRRNGYVGSDNCFSCHEKSAQVWKKSRHGRAWRSLTEDEEKRYWPITFSPDCVSCHVVGFGRRTGFRSFTTTPHLADVGCEQCHGPGALHVRKMMANPHDPDLAIDRANDGGSHCYECHTTERQTHEIFEYLKKWKLIEHTEPEKWADKVAPRR